MRSLLEPSYGPADVYAATGGYGTQALLRDWIKRGLFNTPIPEPRAGKPRSYPWLAMIEAVMFAEGARRGLSVSTVSSAFRSRLCQAIPTYIDADVSDRNYQFKEPDIEKMRGDLPEFQYISSKNPYAWRIDYQWVVSNSNENISGSVDAILVRPPNLANRHLLSEPMSVIFGISGIIHLVQERLGESRVPYED